MPSKIRRRKPWAVYRQSRQSQHVFIDHRYATQAEAEIRAERGLDVFDVPTFVYFEDTPILRFYKDAAGNRLREVICSQKH